LPMVVPVQGVPRGSPQDPPVPDAGHPAPAEQTSYCELFLLPSHSRFWPGEGCNELRVFETGLALGGKTRIRMQEGKSEVALNLRSQLEYIELNC